MLKKYDEMLKDTLNMIIIDYGIKNYDIFKLKSEFPMIDKLTDKIDDLINEFTIKRNRIVNEYNRKIDELDELGETQVRAVALSQMIHGESLYSGYKLMDYSNQHKEAVRKLDENFELEENKLIKEMYKKSYDIVYNNYLSFRSNMKNKVSNIISKKTKEMTYICKNVENINNSYELLMNNYNIIDNIELKKKYLLDALETNPINEDTYEYLLKYVDENDDKNIEEIAKLIEFLDLKSVIYSLFNYKLVVTESGYIYCNQKIRSLKDFSNFKEPKIMMLVNDINVKDFYKTYIEDKDKNLMEKVVNDFISSPLDEEAEDKVLSYFNKLNEMKELNYMINVMINKIKIVPFLNEINKTNFIDMIKLYSETKRSIKEKEDMKKMALILIVFLFFVVLFFIGIAANS